MTMSAIIVILCIIIFILVITICGMLECIDMLKKELDKIL